MYKTSDLIIDYLIFKTRKGYNPYISLGEVRSLIDFMNTNVTLDIDPENLDEYITKLIKEYKETIWNGKKQVNYTDGKISMKYNMIVPNDFENISTKEKLIYFELMKEFLKDFKPRTVTEDKIRIQDSKIVSSILTDLVMKDYINYYIDKKIWPETLNDPIDYILKQDLSQAFNIPSIKQDVVLFHKFSQDRIARLLCEDKNLKISNRAHQCLKKANFDFILKDFEDLKKYFKTDFEIDFSDQTYTILKQPVGISDSINSKRALNLNDQIQKRL